MSEPTLGRDPAAPAPDPWGSGPAGPPPPAGSPEPPPAPARGPGRAIAGFLALGLLTAGLCVGFIYWQRRAAAPADAGQGAPEGSAGGAQPKTVRATVKVPEGHTKAVLRQTAAFDAPVVILLPAGTAVEVTNSTITKSQTWCRVRTVDYQPAASGWMHADVLKME